ncbi:XPG domain containing-domain-containing protein [Aspergillus karnatakaensis]|uniref:XPG domain containing-domain-containing protein n=1 Tax=Aspergillus karnatakaensis TaxID=1810916 RepID=UPI003CCC9579
MGIPRLRYHLLPFSRTVLLQGVRGPDTEGLSGISSAVIDGPSLVYNIYARLLSWFSGSGYNLIDALPTCDEVSYGVILYLVYLRTLGVDIKGIYFDGALPASKRETRLTRLESQRRRLELFCATTKNGFGTTQNHDPKRIIKPEHVLRSRPTSANFGNLPTNPFMVSAVFEDLKYRWDNDNMSNITAGVLPVLHPECISWAKLTTMVPGEADAFCAYEARRTGSCILTNDSDLLLFDLGENGSVIFLDSVELSLSDLARPAQTQLKASMLQPALIAERLGISNLISLAYCLKAHPQAGLVELIQLSKSSAVLAGPSGYSSFVEEYQNDSSAQQIMKRPLGLLDARVSELFWQYRTNRAEEDLHIYLPILNEDHSRRCAWVQSRSVRNVAYSILNLSRPSDERYSHVSEFIRRGQRIAEDRMELRDEPWISTELRALSARLDSFKANFGTDSGFPGFWAMFALHESYGAEAQPDHHDLHRIKRFMSVGYMGKRPGWPDLHLTAQIHAALYSLRILKQLLSISNPHEAVAINLKDTLGNLPPLRTAAETFTRRAKPCAPEVSIAQLSGTFGCPQRGQSLSHTHETDRGNRCSASSTIATARTDAHDTILLNNVSNMYALLREQ